MKINLIRKKDMNEKNISFHQKGRIEFEFINHFLFSKKFFFPKAKKEKKKRKKNIF